MKEECKNLKIEKWIHVSHVTETSFQNSFIGCSAGKGENPKKGGFDRGGLGIKDNDKHKQPPIPSHRIKNTQRCTVIFYSDNSITNSMGIWKKLNLCHKTHTNQNSLKNTLWCINLQR